MVTFNILLALHDTSGKRGIYEGFVVGSLSARFVGFDVIFSFSVALLLGFAVDVVLVAHVEPIGTDLLNPNSPPEPTTTPLRLTL